MKLSVMHGRMFNIGVMLLEPLVVLTLNIINGQLLFKKFLLGLSVGMCFKSVTYTGSE